MTVSAALEQQVASEQERYGAQIEPQRRNEEATDPEREIETDADDQELEQPDGPKPDPAGRALFDPGAYDDPELAVPKIDGLSPDELAITFTGTIKLDRSSPADVALYRRISDGRELELRIAGTHAGSAGKVAEKDESNWIVGTKTVKVATVWVLDPEDL